MRLARLRAFEVYRYQWEPGVVPGSWVGEGAARVLASAPEGGIKQQYESAYAKSYSGWLINAAKVALYAYMAGVPEKTARALEMDPTRKLWVWALAMGAFALGSLGMGVAGSMASRRLGIVYTEDRTAFAMAGGFDVGQWPTLVAQAGLYFALLWTVGMTPDPLGVVRGPLLYLAASTVAGLALTWLTCLAVFRRPGR